VSTDTLELDWAFDKDRTDLLIKGGHLFDPRFGIDRVSDLLVQDGRIAAISDSGLSVPDQARVIEARGLHVFPAFVDPHVHLRVPGRPDEEDLESGTYAAASGGFCSLFAMPNTEPTVDSPSILGSLRQQARSFSNIPTGFVASVTRDLGGESLTDMQELRDAGAFGFTDDGLPVSNPQVLRQALQYQRMCGGVLLLHEEDRLLTEGGVMHEGQVSTALGLGGMPSIAESTQIARDAALASYEGGRVHAQHVTARDSITVLEMAKDLGISISCEVTPHHLTLTDEAVMSLDSRFKMNPPLRGRADRSALVDALRSGVIDCIATDHAPHAREEKEQPFELAPMGVTGVETAFSVLYTELCTCGVIGLDTLIERMTAGAGVFGLETPSLAPGSPAQLCLVDLSAEWKVGENGYASRSENSPFAGRSLTGRVCMTICDGRVVFSAPTPVPGAV
jgi:dihydroorotase